MLSEAMIRDAWLRAEALCECRKDAHGHAGRCNQFLIWAERGEAGTGGYRKPDGAKNFTVGGQGHVIG